MPATRVISELRIGSLRVQAIQTGSLREIRTIRAPSGRMVSEASVASAVTFLRRGAARRSGDAQRVSEVTARLLDRVRQGIAAARR